MSVTVYLFATEEEELVAAEHELSEIEVQLHSLNDRRKLLLERIGKLKDAILLKKNHLLTSRDWSSTGMPIILIHGTVLQCGARNISLIIMCPGYTVLGKECFLYFY
jgi:hypothetical protein